MIGEDSLVENGYDFEYIGADIVSFFIELYFFLMLPQFKRCGAAGREKLCCLFISFFKKIIYLFNFTTLYWFCHTLT